MHQGVGCLFNVTRGHQARGHTFINDTVGAAGSLIIIAAVQISVTQDAVDNGTLSGFKQRHQKGAIRTHLGSNHFLVDYRNVLLGGSTRSIAGYDPQPQL